MSRRSTILPLRIDVKTLEAALKPAPLPSMPAPPPRLAWGVPGCPKCFGDGVIPSDVVWMNTVMLVWCECWKNAWPPGPVALVQIPYSLDPRNEAKRQATLALFHAQQKATAR